MAIKSGNKYKAPGLPTVKDKRFIWRPPVKLAKTIGIIELNSKYIPEGKVIERSVTKKHDSGAGNMNYQSFNDSRTISPILLPIDSAEVKPGDSIPIKWITD